MSRFDRITGRWALSIRIAPLVYPSALGTTFVSAGSHFPSMRHAMLISTYGFALGFIWLLVANYTFMRHRKERALHPGIVIFTYTVAAALKTLVVNGYLYFVYQDSSGAAVRILNGTLSGTLALGLSATLVAIVSEQSEVLNNIRREEDRLVALRSESNLLLTSQAATLRATIEQRVRPVLADISQLLTAALRQKQARDGLAQISQRIRELSDTVIRPISHDVASTRFEVKLSEEVSDRRGLATRLLGDLAAAPVRNTWIAMAIILIGDLPEMYTREGVRGVGRIVIGLTLVWVIFLLYAQFVYPNLKTLRNRLIAWPILYMPTAAIFALVIHYQHEWQWGSWQSMQALMALPVLFATTFLTSAISGGLQRREELIGELAAANYRTRLETARFDREARGIAYQLANAIHGRIQGRLSTAALALDTARVGEELAALRHAEEMVRSAGEALDETAIAPLLPKGLSEELDLLRNQWRGLVQIDASISPNARRVLDSEQLLDFAVADIVEEGLINAVRHAKADRVQVAVTCGDRLFVQVRNPIPPDYVRGSAGLGSTLLDTLCSDWSLVISGNTAVLTAALPTAYSAQAVPARGTLPAMK